MSEQLKSEGMVGFVPIPAGRRKTFGGAHSIVRGRAGLMYLLWAENDDGDAVLTLREMVRGNDMVGPMVTRRRVTLAAADEAVQAGDHPPVFDPDNDGEDDPAVLALMAEHRRLVEAEVGSVIALVGADTHTDVVNVASEKQAKAMTVGDAIEEAWRDDGWSATVDEIVAEVARRTGIEATEESVRKALGRGPYESDGKRPARWTRVVRR